MIQTGSRAPGGRMLDSNINARFKHYSIIHAIKNAAEYNTHISESIGQPVTAINKWKAHDQELVRILMQACECSCLQADIFVCARICTCVCLRYQTATNTCASTFISIHTYSCYKSKTRWQPRRLQVSSATWNSTCRAHANCTSCACARHASSVRLSTTISQAESRVAYIVPLNLGWTQNRWSEEVTPWSGARWYTPEAQD